MKITKIKKIIMLVLILTTIFAITGCNKSIDENVLKVGMELKWPAFESTDTQGNPEGISVMIANELGEYLGKQVKIVDLPFGSLIPALETEKIDVIIASMSITDTRKEKISFSDPYMYFKILSIVNKNSDIKEYDDIFSLEGLRFVGPKSFATLELAKEKANNPSILEFDDKATASLELVSGNADIFMIDAASAVNISRNYPEELMVIYEPVDVSPIGMGVRKNDTELLVKLNEFINKRDELGVNDRIATKYNDTLKELVGKGLEFYLYED